MCAHIHKCVCMCLCVYGVRQMYWTINEIILLFKQLQEREHSLMGDIAKMD